MKYFRLAPVAFLLIAGLAPLRAQEEEGSAQHPQEEIITDFGIDEYIYVPKMTLRLGMRQLSGAKTSFSGRGLVNSVVPLADYTSAGLTRYYHDGTVFKDTRLITDSDGNTSPITPDGYTNSWSYNFLNQIGADGNMAFHGYSADIIDPGMREKTANASRGIEILVEHDMGQFGKKITWNIFAGLSLNDLNSSRSESLAAIVTTTTDYYTLNGQTPPLPPYVGPSTGTSSVVNSDGTITTVTNDNTTLLGAQPLGRIVTRASGIVSNRWKTKGAYFTFRAGPSVSYAITEKFKATISVGAALVFAGSTYTVDQVYIPDVGDDLVKTVEDTTEKLLPGYYADATLEYSFNERAGLYAGALYQSTGSYYQTIETTEAHYSTKIDLSSLQGLRLGMNFRF